MQSKRNYLFYIVTCLILLSGNPCFSQELNIYTTNKDLSQKLSPSAFSFKETPLSGNMIFNINPAIEYQTIQGFGAALTGSSAIVLNYLEPEKREQVLRDLFDSENGAGFNYVRMSIGASDFSSDHWIHMAGGDNHVFEFKDPEGVIPVLRNIKSINRELKIMGTVWSPPACMKTNTQPSNPLIGGNFNAEKSSELSDYLITFINEMKNRDLEIASVTIQNEPLYNQANYMCMAMSAEQQRDFIRNYFGSKLRFNNLSKNLDTKLYVFDHNWGQAFDYVNTIQHDAKAWKYVTGTAFHGYNGNVEEQSRVKQIDPTKDILFTEITGHTNPDGNADDFRWAVQHIIIGNLQNYGSGLIYWNLALDTQWKPDGKGSYLFGPVVTGGPTNCRGIIDINKNSKAVRYNVEYYAIAHASKFIRTGARRIDSGPAEYDNVRQVAFVNPDGSRVMLLFNSGQSNKNVVIKDGNKYASLTVKAQNVVTLHWNDQVKTGIPEMNTRKEELSFSPNPFSEETLIQYHSNRQASEATLRIYDLLGKKVEQITMNENKLQYRNHLLGKGIYIASLTGYNEGSPVFQLQNKLIIK